MSQLLLIGGHRTAGPVPAAAVPLMGQLQPSRNARLAVARLEKSRACAGFWVCYVAVLPARLEVAGYCRPAARYLWCYPGTSALQHDTPLSGQTNNNNNCSSLLKDPGLDALPRGLPTGPRRVRLVLVHQGMDLDTPKIEVIPQKRDHPQNRTNRTNQIA